jgi:hypothetical protein
VSRSAVASRYIIDISEQETEMNGTQLASKVRNMMKAAQFSRFGGPEVLEID